MIDELGCSECGEELFLNLVEKPSLDHVKVVCRNCGHVNKISLIAAFVKQYD